MSVDLSNPAPPVPEPKVAHPTGRPNFCMVTIAGTHYWFSYNTCVAFRRPGQKLVVRQNSWGPTTGKHLSYIDGGSSASKNDRLSGEAFLLALDGA